MGKWEEVFKRRWKCPKCSSTNIVVNEHAFTGSSISRFLDWQAYEYIAVTCELCGYTEFYSKNILGNEHKAIKILDLLFGT